METDSRNMESSRDGQEVEMSSLREQMEAMVARVDDIHEKMSVNP